MKSPWPKARADLTPEQRAIFTDWNDSYLGNILPGKFGWVDRFGHQFAARSAIAGAVTLEIGPGNGSHLAFEQGLNREYVGVEVSDALAFAHQQQ